MPLSHISTSELLEAMPDAQIVVDSLGNIRYANKAFLTLVGQEREDVISENIIHFLRDDSVFDSCMVAVNNGGECLDQETFFLHKNGSAVHTVKNVRILQREEEPLVLATIRDLSAIDSKYKALEKTQSLSERNIQQLSDIVTAKEEELYSTKTRRRPGFAVRHWSSWHQDLAR